MCPWQYDWEGDERPGYELRDLVIYETHVRGFTRHPSSRTVSSPGTYAALSEKLPYLKVTLRLKDTFAPGALCMSLPCSGPFQCPFPGSQLSLIVCLRKPRALCLGFPVMINHRSWASMRLS